MRSFTIRFVLMCSLCISMTAARAQYVAIPDSSFGNWLHAHGYASCLTGSAAAGWALDTTCPAVLMATTMACTSAGITDITGIRYFRRMFNLDCSSNSIITLATLPDSLFLLACNSNLLSSLPVMPRTLVQIDCSHNFLTSLPAFPDSMLDLICSHNRLDSIITAPARFLYNLDCSFNQVTYISSLPIHLGSLSCGHNQLSALPALSDSMTLLWCYTNLFTTLPALPNGLITLNCSGNHLTALPRLPDSLWYFDCNGNALTALPAMRHNLDYFDCRNNQITYLPSLPAQIRYMDCSYNQLTGLPVLPDSMYELQCSYNAGLSCLSNSFRTLQLFYFDGTQISCMPNRFICTSFTPVDPASLPLCTPASGCPFFYNITGNTHQDTSATCTADSLHQGPAISGVKLLLDSAGVTLQQTYTNGYGYGVYSFYTDSVGTYTVRVDTTSLPFHVVCPASLARTSTLDSTHSVFNGQDFGLQCPGVDNGVTAIYGRFRTGRISVINIAAGDMARGYGAHCSAHSAGTFTTTITGAAHYLGPLPYALIPTSVSGPTLTYTILDMDSIQQGSFDISVQTDSQAVAGAGICVDVALTTAGGVDIRTSNDSLTQCFNVVNSYDPNLKEVYPADAGQNADWLTYTIHFQNTGNDTSYTVVVRDTLSSNVDASSFQYIASSHKAVVQLMGNAMTFTFPRINLVDSATDALLSEGWIQYKVKTKPNLPLSTQIKNTAYIYFDLNPAVATNTTVNTVTVTGITPLAANTILHLYPNPNNGTFTLQTSNSLRSDYTITDMLGNVVQQKAITVNNQPIDMGDATAGVYTLIVKGAQPIRFVVVR